jgi:hypothetical protein
MFWERENALSRRESSPSSSVIHLAIPVTAMTEVTLSQLYHKLYVKEKMTRTVLAIAYTQNNCRFLHPNSVGMDLSK